MRSEQDRSDKRGEQDIQGLRSARRSETYGAGKSRVEESERELITRTRLSKDAGEAKVGGAPETLMAGGRPGRNSSAYTLAGIYGVVTYRSGTVLSRRRTHTFAHIQVPEVSHSGVFCC